MKKICQISALLVIVTMLTGCSARQKEELNIPEAELPYGATMKSNKTSYAVPMTYDRRFIEDEQVRAAADYMASIQNQDGALYEAVSLPLYTEYQINEVYSYQNAQELVTALHEGVASQTAEDFRFDMILINDFSDERSGGLEAILDLLDHISDGSFSGTLENAWTLQLQWELFYDNDEKTALTDGQYLYLFKVDGVYYCCM